MSVAKNLTNLKFGKLVAIEKHSKDNHNRWNWLCICDCGKNKIVSSRHLINNKTLSCGCLKTITAINNGRNSAHKISGEKSYLYNINLTDLERSKRRNLELTKNKNWRNQIFIRDSFTCNICGIKGDKLQVHHLNSYAYFKEQRFDLDNGVTLCKKCHTNFHNSLGGYRQKCTKEDYIAYKSNFNLEHELNKLNG